jgi:hypothetical protein
LNTNRIWCARAVRAAVALTIAWACLSGCLLPRTELAVSYDPSQGSYIHDKGEGRIEGQAFLLRDSGSVIYAAGRPVYLIPVTEYSAARIDTLFRGRQFVSAYAASFRQFADTDPDYLRDQRITRADNRGRFSFELLAPGRYIVMTTLTWMSDDLLRGGFFFDYATIEGAETVELVLSAN